nr:nucleotide kinase domain-containing protein [Halomarina rubra]
MFWRFICERQTVWLRRVVLQQDPPWTSDEILQRDRFTNVYRELDPGTQYVIQEILSHDAPPQDRIFNTLIYRLIGRSETHKFIGFQRLDEYDIDAFESALKTRRDDLNQPVFTGAYMVSGYNQMGSSDKVENVSRLFGEVRDQFDEFYKDVQRADHPQSIYSAIRGLPGYGNFLSYQVLVDLLYPLSTSGESLLPFTHDEWSSPGPGAQRGLKTLLENYNQMPFLDAMHWLRKNQHDEFNRLGLKFPYLKDSSGNRVEISLANIQNCLCEFYKYHKITHGQGRARRRFRTSSYRSTRELEQLYSEYPISIDATHYQSQIVSD